MADDKKKPSKSSKLYSDSPTTKRGKDGKVGVSRPSDENTQAVADAAPEPDGEGVQPTDIKATVSDMHDRHSSELHDMHKRHMKEMKKAYMGTDDAEK